MKDQSMNEEQIEMLMQSTTNGLSVSNDLTMRAQNVRPKVSAKRRNFKWSYAISAGVAMAGIAFIAMRPQPSSASALERMQTAIKGIKNMHVQSFSHWNGNTRLLQETYYKDRVWLNLSHSYRANVWGMVKDGQRYIWDDGSTTATSEAFDSHGATPDMTALQFVEREAGIGNDPKTYSSITVDHEDVDGKKTYALIVDQKPGPNDDPAYMAHSEIVVDKATDLPLSMTQTMPSSGSGKRLTEYKYEFDVPLGDHFFEPCNGKATTIRDLPKERKALYASWRTPLGVAKLDGKSCEVREVDVNPSGTVTMVYSGPLEDNLGPFTTFAPTTLSDSVGTVYVRIPDLLPGAITSDEFTLTKELRYGKQLVAICVWVPLEPKNAVDKELKIGFQTRTFNEEPQDSVGPTDQKGKVVFSSVKPRHIDTEVPDWSLPLRMDYIQVQQPTSENVARATYYEKEGKLVDAARWYQEAYDVEKKVFKGIAYRNLESAVSCLERAGKKDEALALKKQALSEKSVDSNLTDAERDAAKKELEQLG